MKIILYRSLVIASMMALSILGHRCHRNMETLWLTEVGSSPVVSSPLLADINGDNILDVAVTTFDRQLSIIHGQTGHELPGWPFDGLKGTYHAAPLLYDIDKDGLNEVLLCTSDGQIIFLKSDGKPVPGQKMLQIPPLKVKKDWYVAKPYQSSANEPRMNAQFAEYSDFINTQPKDGPSKEDVPWRSPSPPSGLSGDGSHVYVDAHVLSTPVIADFNADGLENELIVAVNFYFDETRLLSYPKNSSLPAKDLENYLGSAIVVFNLVTGNIIYKTVLEITKRSSLYPGYILSMPTVLDNASIVIGSSVGNIFHIKKSDKEPKIITTMDSIQGQISVADTNDDGNLELIMVDDSGNVACMDLNGKRVWERRISGSPASGIRIADVNGDNLLDVVFASYDGYLWVLNGDNGQVLPGWPAKLPGELRATVLVTKMRPGDDGGLDLVIPLLDGVLAIVRGSDQCTEFIETGLPALSSAVSAKLLPWKQGLEVVIGSTDGSVICLGDVANFTGRNDMMQEGLFSWKAETSYCSGTTFNSAKVGIAFTKTTTQKTQFIGTSFPLEFEIIDLQVKDFKWNHYRTKIFIGNKVLSYNKTLSSPGVYKHNIPIPLLSGKFAMVIKMTTPNEQCFQDSFHISLNTHQLNDMRWYLLVPFLTMSCLLLVLHGHAPPQDVLPTFMRR